MLINEVTAGPTDIKQQLISLRDSLASDFYIDAAKCQRYLYRGMHDIGDMFTSRSTLRRPKGLGVSETKTLNQMLTLSGFKSLRTNSICCAANRMEARRWSMDSKTMYLIFPHNGYAFTWSHKINDVGGNYRLNKSLRNVAEENGPITADIAHKFIDAWGFRNDDMTAALTTGNEITIAGTYTAIAYRDRTLIEEVFGWASPTFDY